MGPLVRFVRQKETIIWLVLLLGLIAVTALLQTLHSAVGLAIVAGLALLPLAVVLWLHPKWLLWGMIAFVPFHALTVLILVGTLQVPWIIPRLFVAWKEVLLAAIVLYLVLRMLQTGKLPFKVGSLDVLILAFFSLSLIYVMAPSELADLGTKLRGFKVDVFFFLAYFAARSVNWSRRDVKLTVTLLFGLGVLAALVAIAERFLLPGDFLLRIGYSDFAVFQGYDLNDKRFFWSPSHLAASFYGWIGGHLIHRSGSFYISTLGYAFASLLFVSLAYSFFLNAKSRSRKMIFGSLTLLFILGIALSYTRSALASLFFSLFVLTLWLFRPASRLMLVTALALLLALSALFLAIPADSPLDYLFGDMSTKFHIRGWVESFEIMASSPLGRGLGTAGSVSHKFLRDKGVSNESWYFQIATEMGILMMLLFVGIVAYWLASCLRIARRSQDPLIKPFAWGLFGGGVGLSLNGLFLHVWLEPHVALTCWILAGILVQHTFQKRPASPLPRQGSMS
jgi:hypothetical protein